MNKGENKTSKAGGAQAADYIRARTPEQKQERMDAIMAAADKLFQAQPYHQISMGAIAEELGWSRSNLYKYAATQEEIFLSLHEQKNRAWLEDLASALQGAPLPSEEFARIWAKTAKKHADFLRYQEIIVSIIESNVTLERLTDFKRNFAQLTEPVVNILAKQCSLEHSAALDLYLRLLYQAPGLWNHFHCTTLAAQAMKAAGLPKAKGSFTEAYADFVLLCIS